MKNKKILTTNVLRFLYCCLKKDMKNKPITYGGRMSEGDFKKYSEIVEVEKQKLNQLNIRYE